MADGHSVTIARNPRERADDRDRARTSTPAAPVPSLGHQPLTVGVPPPSWNLTPQQWRVFLLVGRALSNKAIAHELKVAESTVKAHISAIFKISGCRNRTEAALLSLRVRYGLFDREAETAVSHTALEDLRRTSKVRVSR